MLCLLLLQTEYKNSTATLSHIQAFIYTSTSRLLPAFPKALPISKK